MAASKAGFIRKQIQHENFRRAYFFFVLLMAAMPFALTGVQLLMEGWYIGNSLLWGVIAEALAFGAVFMIRAYSGKGRAECARFLRILWAGYLLCSDLLVLNMKLSASAQLMLWIATLAYTVCDVCVFTEFCVGMALQAVVAAALIIRLQLGVDAVLYNLLLVVNSCILSYYIYRFREQRCEDLWQLRLANQKAEVDPMTGLYNRRGLEPRLKGFLDLCRNWNRPLAVIMTDIDNFKKFNDTFGHPEGDKCIIAVADQIQRAADLAGGVCARVGGEEFVLAVKNRSEDEVIELAEQLNRSVEELKIPQSPGNIYPFVTISVGIEFCQHLQKTDIDKLYEKADQALYRAKENGRNCIFLGSNCVSKKTRRYYA